MNPAWLLHPWTWMDASLVWLDSHLTSAASKTVQQTRSTAKHLSRGAPAANDPSRRHLVHPWTCLILLSLSLFTNSIQDLNEESLTDLSTNFSRGQRCNRIFKFVRIHLHTEGIRVVSRMGRRSACTSWIHMTTYSTASLDKVHASPAITPFAPVRRCNTCSTYESAYFSSVPEGRGKGSIRSDPFRGRVVSRDEKIKESCESSCSWVSTEQSQHLPCVIRLVFRQLISFYALEPRQHLMAEQLLLCSNIQNEPPVCGRP